MSSTKTEFSREQRTLIWGVVASALISATSFITAAFILDVVAGLFSVSALAFAAAFGCVQAIKKYFPFGVDEA